jgi:hypothetical protein
MRTRLSCGAALGGDKYGYGPSLTDLIGQQYGPTAATVTEFAFLAGQTVSMAAIPQEDTSAVRNTAAAAANNVIPTIAGHCN